MNILKTFRKVIAAELNHLYTVPPFQAPSGLDCGWYCREHAMHAFLVARMFGAEAFLVSGDFAISSPAIAVHSIGSGDGHSWCSINGIIPVDLSITFKYFKGVSQLNSPIAGSGKNGEWKIRYSKDDSIVDSFSDHTNEIALIERKIEKHNENDILQNPYCFIHPPAETGPPSWHTLYGQDIYARITLHCFSLATGHNKSIRHKFTSTGAVKYISDNYHEAVNIIRKTIK
jgi:hypothetical protein